ncbi:MAG: hypothetical protein JSS81_16995 [Acidobacteria bacterium]|nr:hypothetical protein [Acidobacteriota bacterium]
MPQEDKGSDSTSHQTGTLKGEEQSQNQGGEAGREETGESGAGRPTGVRTARDSTSINPDDREPIDPKMPHMPPA